MFRRTIQISHAEDNADPQNGRLPALRCGVWFGCLEMSMILFLVANRYWLWKMPAPINCAENDVVDLSAGGLKHCLFVTRFDDSLLISAAHFDDLIELLPDVAQ